MMNNDDFELEEIGHETFQPEEEEQPRNNKKEKVLKKVDITPSFIITMMGIVSLALFIICKICINFGYWNGAFYGIMSIFIYLLSFGGLTWAYLKDRKLSFELWFNLAVFVLGVIALR